MSTAPAVNLQPTIGAYFIAAIASVGLLGVTTLQSWRYFLNFPADHPILKVTVSTVWILEFVKSTLAIYGSYNVTVVHWGDRSILGSPGWSLRSVLIFTAFIVVIVHLFFVHKIWLLLRKSPYIPAVLLVLSVSGFALGVAAFTEAVVAKAYEDDKFNMADRLTTAALACALVVDWTVTFTLVLLLKGQKSSFGRTNRLVKRLIFYAINIGLLTSISDLVVLVLLNAKFNPPEALYSISLYEIVGNLYANSLLACLNSRKMVVSELTRTIDFERSDLNFAHSAPTTINRSTGQAPTRPQPQVVYLINKQSGSQGGDLEMKYPGNITGNPAESQGSGH